MRYNKYGVGVPNSIESTVYYYTFRGSVRFILLWSLS